MARVLLNAHGELLDPVDQGGGQEMVLAGEVAVDGAHRHIGAGGDIAHLHGVVPAIEAEGHGGVDDPLAPGLLCPRERTGEHLLHSAMLSTAPPGDSGDERVGPAPR
jgi:hypothetical protein